jgi:2-polyprenyl-3-methyl-5-hydroxy-6-metoxy-1,4-benzoquinol methylase
LLRNPQSTIVNQQFFSVPLLSKYLTGARLSRISPHLGVQVLDLGCGYGEILDYLPSTVSRIVLLDRSSERQEAVERRLAGKKLSATFLTAEIDRDEVSLDLAPFDTVVMAALLEHLRSPEIALKNLRQLMKSGATLVLTTPTPLGGKLHWLGSFAGLVYAEAAQEHVKFYNYTALKSLLESSGFHIHLYEKFLFGLNQFLTAGLA